MTNIALPHSREAEEAVLGCVLIDPETFPNLYFLKQADFYIHRNGFVWDAFTKLSVKHSPIDLLTLSEELEKAGLLAEVGGAAFLTSIINQVPSTLNAESYGKIVQEHSMRRRLINAANSIASLAYKGDTMEEIIGEANKTVTDALTIGSDNSRTLADALSIVYDRATQNAERIASGIGLEVGLSTGFIDLDKMLSGIEDEESVIIAARPGEGKTSFLLNIAQNALLKYGKKVALFSQEMSAEQVARRMAAQYAEVDTMKIKTGTMDKQEWQRFTKAVETLASKDFYIEDSTDLTPAKLRAKCLQLKRTHGLDLVLIDYLQLMSAGIKTENRTREVGYISRQIKILNGELKCPIISASQMSRDSEKRAESRPQLSDLRDSGDLEQDANTVIFLYRPDKTVNETEVIVAKRRDGKTGSVKLFYKPQFTKFENGVQYNFKPTE